MGGLYTCSSTQGPARNVFCVLSYCCFIFSTSFDCRSDYICFFVYQVGFLACLTSQLSTRNIRVCGACVRVQLSTRCHSAGLQSCTTDIHFATKKYSLKGRWGWEKSTMFQTVIEQCVCCGCAQVSICSKLMNNSKACVLWVCSSFYAQPVHRKSYNH